MCSILCVGAADVRQCRRPKLPVVIIASVRAARLEQCGQLRLCLPQPSVTRRHYHMKINAGLLHFQRMLLHPAEIRHSKTSGWIPPFSPVPACPLDLASSIQFLPCLVICAITASRASIFHIGQEVLAMCIQPRIDEAHRRLLRSKTRIVQERGNGCPDW